MLTILTNPALLYILLLGAMFGSSLVVSRFGIRQFEPGVFVCLGFLLASLAHVLVYVFQKKRAWPRDPWLWVKAGVTGVIGPALTTVSNTSALQYLSSSIVSVFITLNPVVVVLLAHLFTRDERLTWKKFLGVLIAFAGASLLVSRGESGLLEVARADWRGYAWAGIGALGSAGAIVLIHIHLRGEDMFDTASIRIWVATFFLLPFAALTTQFDLSRVQWSGIVSVLYAGLIGSFLAYITAVYIVKRFGGTWQSLKAYVIPVVTTILGAIFLREQVTAVALLSMALIFIGITIIMLQTRRHAEL